jgi:type III secretion protein K
MTSALFGERLIEFNLLPSRTLHPSRHEQYAAPQEAVPAGLEPAWHRHWSRDILRRLGLLDRPVRDAGRPELALALLPPDRLARTARLVGATLCAPRLRRAIAGAEVRQFLAGLGAEALDFARQSAGALHPGIEGNAALGAQQAVDEVDRLGRATLMAAMQGGGPELALRAELKLPADPAGNAPFPAPDALSLALRVLKITEPSWHSSFPAIP